MSTINDSTAVYQALSELHGQQQRVVRPYPQFMPVLEDEQKQMYLAIAA
jgi:hypothetical protein